MDKDKIYYENSSLRKAMNAYNSQKGKESIYSAIAATLGLGLFFYILAIIAGICAK